MIDTAESLICRGMRDLLPEDMARFRRIEQVFRDACLAWGYAEVRTPTLEHLYLFTSAGTLSPQLLGRVYSFLDWDGWTGERVVLRPDATIPVARLFREQLQSRLAKLAYVANIFRFSNSADRPREVWQCGAELIGDSWPEGDVELIRLARQVVASLGFPDARLVLSHTGVVRALLERAGFAIDEQAELYDRLLDGDDNVVRDIEARLPNLGPALRLLTEVGEGGVAYIANLRSAFLAQVPAMQPALDELELIARAAAGTGENVSVSVTAVRDFEYYTGPVFHIAVNNGVVAGGGRYDHLIGDADGASLPACGFALHVDELLSLLPREAVPARETVRVIPSGRSAAQLAAASIVCEQLHRAGLSASLVREGDAGLQVSLSSSSTKPAFRVTGSGRVPRDCATLDELISFVKGSR